MSDSLFPSGPTRLLTEAWLSDALIGAQQRVAAGPVHPTYDPETFHEQLLSYDFTSARPLRETLRWVIEQLEHGLVQVTHPQYFGLFNPTPTFPAQCADHITAAFNPQLATVTTSPAAVAIEAQVIHAFARRIGMPASTRGHFTAGGSQANYTALLLALAVTCPEFAQHGARAFAGPPVFYVSQDSHMAWVKIAHQAGIGRSAMRMIPTDGNGRLSSASLIEAIEADRARGAVPCMIAATAGTTAAGMIDPLMECAAIAAQYDLWYHIDAAWGGALIASESRRHLLAGLDGADSITIDAHKWFATTMGCGMFLTASPSLLANTFQAAASYMPSHAQVDPYVSSMQWSRRFLGLGMFVSLAVAGWDGYGAHVEHALALIEELKICMLGHDWTVISSPTGVLCLIPPRASVRRLVERVVASGRAWVSVAVYERRDVIRVCVTSGLSTSDDIAELASVLLATEADLTE